MVEPERLAAPACKGNAPGPADAGIACRPRIHAGDGLQRQAVEGIDKPVGSIRGIAGGHPVAT